MKFFLCLCGTCFLLFCACKKQNTIPAGNFKADDISLINFTRYTIKQGNQYCDQSTFVMVNYTELKFVVRFDSSAIYTTTDPANQNDINKLFGFSDDSMDHHLYSARFGWRWSDKALHIFAYIYNKGIRDSKELGIIQIGDENTCSIKVNKGFYIFTLNNSSDTLLRSSTTSKGSGYKLYPYFGGDETAPHEITILIKEITAD